MLKIYDYLDEMLAMQQIKQHRRHQKLEYYASDLMLRLGSDIAAADFEETLLRTFKACSALGISIDENFKKTFQFDGENMVADWQLSPLACYLLVINGNPMNPSVAKIQLFAAFHQK